MLISLGLPWWFRTVKMAMQETQVRSLGQEGPLKKGKATHARILAWRIPWTEDTVHGVAESDMTKQLTLSHFFPGI